jgi:uncharacterized membrane protein
MAVERERFDAGFGELPAGPTAPVRVTSVDAMRGAVMVNMALDHVRDFIHAGAMSFNPLDLGRTTPAIFFTRWVTHVCAPAFMLLAGVGAALLLQRDGSTARVSRFLWTRGPWLIVLELTVMRLAMNFTFDRQYPVLILVLCALGVSMIALAALVHLPLRAVAAIALALVALHNLLDGVQAKQLGAWAPLWNLLHQQGVFVLGGVPFVVAYPVLPWIGVMAAGFCLGHLFAIDQERRYRLLLAGGSALVVLFVVMRSINVYGDPSRWSAQSSAVFTALSFLNTTKYPPSLAFILMTLGPVLLALAWLERRRPGLDHPLTVIGRVPLFFYVVHFWLIHVVASAMAWLRYGTASFDILFMPLPSMGGAAELFPAGFGYSLPVTYAVWVGVVLAMYPLCRRYDRFKSRHRAWWTSFV